MSVERRRAVLAAIAFLGTLAALALAGWRAGSGFLVGASISVLNFYWIKGKCF